MLDLSSFLSQRNACARSHLVRYLLLLIMSVQNKTVAAEDMERMQPEQEKPVIVISGPDKGQQGLLYVRMTICVHF